GRGVGARRREAPWQWDQMGTLSEPLHCAMAHEGAIAAWAMNGRLYWRRTVRCPGTGVGACLSATMVVSTGSALSHWARLVSSGSVGSPRHVAALRRASTPACAAASVRATTPAELPWRPTAMIPPPPPTAPASGPVY